MTANSGDTILNSEMKEESFLKKLREGQGISQRDLSEQSGISRGRVRRFEEGGFEDASYDELRRIAQVLHQEVPELLQLLDKPSAAGPTLARAGHAAHRLNAPELGYQIVSFFPARPDLFAGKLFVGAGKKLTNAHTPKASTIFLQMFLGPLNVEISREKYELREGDSFTFKGIGPYTIENPSLRESVTLVLTVPSFRLG